MTQRFCTLFNTDYLARGLVLYRSLCSVGADFHLYVVAMDDATVACLAAMALPHVTVIPVGALEDAELLAVKPSRSVGEYCWTCTPAALLYCLERFRLDHCTYIDADLCFYADPGVLQDELGDGSILLSEHRYDAAYHGADAYGTYCVQYITFRQTEPALAALHWWRAACIEWCYARCEDGRFGDQKYLDDWPQRFSGVRVLQHRGSGVAPWNLRHVDVRLEGAALTVVDRPSGQHAPLVFFHFHGLRFHAGDTVALTHRGYRIGRQWRTVLYRPYLRHLVTAAADARRASPEVPDPMGTSSVRLPPRGTRRLSTLAANVAAAARWLAGRAPAFTPVFNHVYRRIDLS